MRSTRAIILFVRDERLEEVKKPLPGRHRSCGYAALNRSIIARLDPLREKVDLIVATDGNVWVDRRTGTIDQHGNSFGERFTNALTDAFALGYHEVIVVGNDCPTLSPDDISLAFDTLSKGAAIVAAPARDGGAYLIGACREGVITNLLCDLPWQSDLLFDSLMCHPGAAALARVRDDFDSWALPSAVRALDSLLGSPIAHTAVRLLDSPFLSGSSLKSLTRIHLPAPPRS